MRQGELAVGSLVRVRGRDWIVLPSATKDVVNLRPITGVDGAAVGLFLPLEGESLKPATFSPS
jgi:hypothetical protein